MRHDLSPDMLKRFLRLRAEYLALADTCATPKASNVRAAKVQLRQLAGVTPAEFAAAWTGQLMEPEPRVKLWSALGISPHLLGLRLVHGGQVDVRAESRPDPDAESEVPG